MSDSELLYEILAELQAIHRLLKKEEVEQVTTKTYSNEIKIPDTTSDYYVFDPKTHQCTWTLISMHTGGDDYKCSVCGARKTVPPVSRESTTVKVGSANHNQLRFTYGH